MMSNNWIKKMIVSATAVAVLAGCTTGESSEPAAAQAVTAVEGSIPWVATKNTTRINSSDPVQAAVIVSRTLWPANREDNRPGGVILVDRDDWRTALVAADFIHHPNNGPILYASKDAVPEATMSELKRLKPTGVVSNSGIQVILAGEFTPAVEQMLKDAGYKTKRIGGKEPADVAKEVDRYYAEVAGELPISVLVGNVDEPDYTLPAANWIAHMPEPLLYVKRDEVPRATIESLELRKGKANIYLLGPESVVSAKVERELGAYGKVKRIAGDNPYEQSIAFAKYKDAETGFGWGIERPGRNLSFVALGSPPSLAIAAAPFSHLGKHAPLIWTDLKQMPESVMRYVMTIQPKFQTTPSDGPFNHAWLTGGTDRIDDGAQGEIDAMLEIVSATGAGHTAHGSQGQAAQKPAAEPTPQAKASNGGHAGH